MFNDAKKFQEKPFSLHQGDCLDVMRSMESDSIDLTVTSPPYDNLRTYNGYTFDFENIARELSRVTKPGGVVVWVIGDATVNGSETGTSFRHALFFLDVCGFKLHDTMIYEKDAISFPDKNRYQQSFEYMFVFSRGAPSTRNIIHDRHNVSFGRKVTGTGRNASGSTSRASCYGNSIKEFGARWNVWRMATNKGNSKSGHPAAFPEALARDHILSWSNPGDVVLDPFLGSGTTGKMAVLADRRFVGIEISQEYLAIAEQRIEAALDKRGESADLSATEAQVPHG
ncbi:site-specific DNA-methyltransferase [Paraburkholderia sp. 31.1]|uniref:DNA-methyltransferase n=1 Tax=Paraburkholderia sp. 31.1 TaxID=2615205 RepID=UPI0016566384|nr:site-specific DNA-methyltransferase [Paraburkholderia sp. 31.1]MBC8720927.1 site-specific DNA-methyltransferase [Paraburkholderia sp. 31.1]